MKSYYLHPRWVYENYGNNKDMLYAYETIAYNTRFSAGMVSGIRVEAGQLLTTTEKLAEMCKMNINSMRYALKRFSADGGLSVENYGKKGILITLLPPFITGECKGTEKNGRTSRKASKEKPKKELQKNKNTYQSTDTDLSTYTPDRYAGYDLTKIDFNKPIILPKGKRNRHN